MTNKITSLAKLACILALLDGADARIAQADERTAMELEAKIALGDVRGRIDHMAVDLARQRVFVAELGNDSVGIIDLKTRKLIRTLSGLKEPQGVGYLPAVDTLYVANAGDGSVRRFSGADYAPAGQIGLGDDADNIRVDEVANRIFVGYGNGALAVIDGENFRKLADMPLRAHPEGFQLESGGKRIFVNVPKVKAIAVLDRESGKQIADWPAQIAGANFPMALDPAAGQVLAAFRSPAKLGVFAMKDGSLTASAEICGDADDVFIDNKRHRIYVSCGEGFLDVLDAENPYKRLAHIPTAAGARTALFIPELDRLLLAVRAVRGEPAAIWVFRPNP
jgi:YVTN family beta-propeller protein